MGFIEGIKTFIIGLLVLAVIVAILIATGVVGLSLLLTKDAILTWIGLALLGAVYLVWEWLKKK